MSSSDFRNIGSRIESHRNDRLFRAAVSAFSALTRPSRREAVQLADLAEPLYESLSPEALRFAAAVLSESAYAPHSLVRRIASEPVAISAPLLMRSPVLADIDLVALVGRHGLQHARAIARRTGLNSVIAQLLRALRDEEIMQCLQGRPPHGETGGVAEDAREHLRSMMQPTPLAAPNPAHGPQDYEKLRDTALSGVPAFFETALADVLELDFHTARRVAAEPVALAAALKTLSLTVEQAFLVASALRPEHMDGAGAIRAWTQSYASLARIDVLMELRAWRSESLAAEPQAPGQDNEPKSASVLRLRVS